MKKVQLLTCLLFLFLIACTTTYQPMGFTGGYDETRLDENVFSITFRGNGFTRMERANDFALLRAAELTQQSGFKYFAITQSDSFLSTSTYTTPTQSQTTGQIRFYGRTAYTNSSTTTYGGQTYNVNKPKVSLTIICFTEKPDTEATIFNAQYVMDSIKKKYNIQ